MANLTEAYRLAAATQTASGQTENFSTGAFDQMEVDINVGTLTATSIAFTYYRYDPWLNAYPVASKTLTGTGQVMFDVGPGMTNSLNPGGQGGYIAWVIVGTSANFSIWVGGK